jgi:hypothetical protein
MDIHKEFQKRECLFVVVSIPFFEKKISMTPIGYHGKKFHKKTA